jgi:hypothetical protein
MEDLNRMFEFDWQPRGLPVAIPRYWPYAPDHAPAFEVWRCNAFVQQPFTTLDSFIPPAPPNWTMALGQAKVVPMQGQRLLYGNAPTRGIYTGVQEE